MIAAVNVAREYNLTIAVYGGGNWAVSNSHTSSRLDCPALQPAAQSVLIYYYSLLVHLLSTAILAIAVMTCGRCCIPASMRE